MRSSSSRIGSLSSTPAITCRRRRRPAVIFLFLAIILSTIPLVIAESDTNTNDNEERHDDATQKNNNSPSSESSSSSDSTKTVRIANGPAPSYYDDGGDGGGRVMQQQRYGDGGRPSKTPSRTFSIPNNSDDEDSHIAAHDDAEDEEEILLEIAEEATANNAAAANNNEKEEEVIMTSPSPNNSNGDATTKSSVGQPSITDTTNIYQQHDDDDDEYDTNDFIDTSSSSSSSTSSIIQRFQSFATLFTPQMEEYTLTKFDPYSFSGAPLGGWGRATRSRLASLPIRFVSDYGGGLELKRPTTEEFFKSGCDTFGEYYSVYKNGGEEKKEEEVEWMCLLTKDGLRKLDIIQEYFDVWGMTDEKFHRVWSGAAREVIVGNNNKNINNRNDDPNKQIGLVGFLQIFEQFDALYTNGGEDPWESTGPHFTFRDGMGRQFVCRVYDEGELVIDNYMDSMFNPAVRVGYKDVVYGEKEGEEWGGKGKGNSKKKKGKKNDEDVIIPGVEDVSIEVETFIFDGGVDENNVAEVISSNIQKLLEKVGIALDGQHDGEDIVVEAVVDNNNDLADIIKAAIQGAGINKGNAAAATDKKDSTPPPPSPPNNAKRLSTQLTADQIINALEQLRGFCSQLHLGWWSYEWCHEYQVRQFHVDVSADATAADGRKYEIQHVTTIGHFQGKTEIINPRGIYDGTVKKGTSTMYILDKTGMSRQYSSVIHGPEEDEEYSQPFYDGGQDMKSVMPNRLRNELLKYKTEQHQRLGNSGGIVRQQFEHGDMCEEVGILRQVSVEYRCCTEDEISHWLKAKRKPTDAYSSQVPLAVLVSVQEDETCVYRAKVCTPVLCPESLTTQEEVASAPLTPGKPTPQQQDNTNDDNQVGAALGLQDAIEDVFRSLNEEGGFAEVKIVMGNEDTVDSLNELIRAAQNGEDFSKSEAFKKVMEAMDLGKQKSGKVVQPESIIDGKSIREVLQNTLGVRPCLVKNLGW